ARSSFSSSLADPPVPSRASMPMPPLPASPVNDTWLCAIRDWGACVKQLVDTLKASLTEVYRQYERDATGQMVEALFTDKKFRTSAVARMRNASVHRLVTSVSPSDFWKRYDSRFRNYERARHDLSEINSMVEACESGISPDRVIKRHTISRH